MWFCSCSLYACYGHVLCFLFAAPFSPLVSLLYYLNLGAGADNISSPDQCNIEEIRVFVERLAALLAEGLYYT